MATLYSHTFPSLTGVNSLPGTFLLTGLSPPGGTTHATVSSITIMFYKPTFEGTYNMRCRIKDSSGNWDTYSYEDVVWAGETTQIIAFTFANVTAQISNSRFEVQVSKNSGPAYTTYLAYDDVGDGSYFVVEGAWVGISPPEKPITPTPTDTSASVTLDQATVTWEDGGGADTYDVYFGPSGNITLQSSAQVGLSWGINILPFPYVTVYQWRIDATNDAGTTTGDVWLFTTLTFAPPVPTGAGSTSPNMMQLIKRLVAVAKNKFWYEDI